MKLSDILLNCGDTDSSIFSIVATRAIKKGDAKAVGICYESRAISVSYAKLIGDSVALSRIIGERKPLAILLHGGSAIEAATLLLSASLLEIPIVLCDQNSSPDTISDLLDSTGGIFSVSEELRGRDLAVSELSAVIESRLSDSRKKLPHFRGGGFLLTFYGNGRVDSYSEDCLIHSASEFGILSSLCGKDTTLSDISPFSPTGLVCALLSPIISGGEAVFTDVFVDIEDAARLVRPSRLFCTEKMAENALSVIRRAERGDAALPTVYSQKKSSSFDILGKRLTLYKRRRLYSGRLMRLGGRLSSITLTDPPSSDLVDHFADVGIVPIAILSTAGCPFIGLRNYLSASPSWRLPRGLFADICQVGKGGVGRITVSGRGLCLPSDTPIKRGTSPGKFRLDDTDGLSLVTDLCGYILPNGNICLKKRLISDFFCKSSCNS